jgi:hypothetical protein
MNSIRIDLKMISESSGVIDVFSNSFDPTWFNMLPEDQKDKRIFSATPFESKMGLDNGSVTYTYNSDLFRCDEFGSNNSKYHVVFGGCSETEGVGGNLDEIWSYKVYLELKEKYDIGNYYSLGKSGNGWHKIALSLIEYVNKYGKPTHFFALLPNIGRNFYWHKDIKRWKYDQKYVYINGEKSPHSKENLIDEDEHKKQFIEFAVGWKIFQNYCKSNNIKILYSTWDTIENNNLIIYDNQFKNFHPVSRDYELQKFIEEKYPTLKVPQNRLKKRDGHKGDIVHEYWKECFMKEIKIRGLFND